MKALYSLAFILVLAGCAKHWQVCVASQDAVSCTRAFSKHDATAAATVLGSAPGIEQLYQDVWVRRAPKHRTAAQPGPTEAPATQTPDAEVLGQ